MRFRMSCDSAVRRQVLRCGLGSRLIALWLRNGLTDGGQVLAPLRSLPNFMGKDAGRSVRIHLALRDAAIGTRWGSQTRVRLASHRSGEPDIPVRLSTICLRGLRSWASRAFMDEGRPRSCPVSISLAVSAGLINPAAPQTPVARRLGRRARRQSAVLAPLCVRKRFGVGQCRRISASALRRPLSRNAQCRRGSPVLLALSG